MLNGQSTDLSTRPKTLACFICGREFGTKSLGIHMKKCRQKFTILQSQKIDKELRVKLPNDPQLLVQILQLAQEGNLNHQQISQFNSESLALHKYKVLPACKYCSRTFNEQSLLSHIKGCAKKTTSNQQSKSSAYKLADQIKKPRVIMCCCCGRQFGLTSLKIHYTQCQQKFKNEEMKKPKKQRNPVIQFNQEMEQMINYKIEWTAQQISQFNETASSIFRNKALVQCPNCSRKFFPESFKRHEKNCKLINGNNMQDQKSASGYQTSQIRKPKVLMCHICGRQFGLSSLIIHLKSCQQKFHIAQNKRPKKQRRLLPSMNFTHPNQFNLDEALSWDINKIQKYNQFANQVYKGCSLWQCRFCNRKFFQEALQKHLVYCQKNTAQKALKQQSKQKQRNHSAGKVTALKSKSPLKNSVKQAQSEIQDKYLRLQNKSISISSNKNNQNLITTINQQQQKLQQTINIDSQLADKIIQKEQVPSQNQFLPKSNQIEFLENNKSEIDIKHQIQQKQKANYQQIIKLQQKISLQQKTQSQKKIQLQQKVKLQQKGQINLIGCNKCGRKFSKDRIQKHESICKGTKRKENNINETAQLQVKRNLSKPQVSTQIKQLVQQKNEQLLKQKDQSSHVYTQQQRATKLKDKQLTKFKDRQACMIKNQQSTQCKQQVQISQQQNFSGLQQCLKCGKKFLPQKIQKHMQKCKDVVFKTRRLKKQKRQIQQIQPQPLIQQAIRQNLINSEQTNEFLTCTYCKRKFIGSDRVIKHQAVCAQKKTFQQQNIINQKRKGLKPKFQQQNRHQRNQNLKPKIQKMQDNNQINLQQSQVENINLKVCKKCNRKFVQDRLQKHQNICKGIKTSNQNKCFQNKNQLKPVQCQNKKIFNVKKPISSTNRPSDNQQIGSFSKNNKIIKFENQKQSNTQDTQKISEKFLNDDSKIDEFDQVQRIGCSKCGRKFAQDRVQKHQLICKVIKKSQVQECPKSLINKRILSSHKTNQIQNLTKQQKEIKSILFNKEIQISKPKQISSQIKKPKQINRQIIKRTQIDKSAQIIKPSQIIKSKQITCPKSIIKQFRQLKQNRINIDDIDKQLQSQLNKIKTNGFTPLKGSKWNTTDNFYKKDSTSKFKINQIHDQQVGKWFNKKVNSNHLPKID